jgi:hypothetical protein
LAVTLPNSSNEMVSRLRGYLAFSGVVVYLLSGLLTIGLAVNFVVSLIRGDLSPWWFWPLGIVSVVVLVIVAGNLMRLADK